MYLICVSHPIVEKFYLTKILCYNLELFTCEELLISSKSIECFIDQVENIFKNYCFKILFY